MKRAVLIVGHGSKREGSSGILGQVASALQKREPDTFFQTAFLEINSPNIPEGIGLCFAQGAEEIVVVPYFVQPGRHVLEDIPRIISLAQEKHPQQKIRLSSHLAFDERIVSVVLDRIAEARKE